MSTPIRVQERRARRKALGRGTAKFIKGVEGLDGGIPVLRMLAKGTPAFIALFPALPALLAAAMALDLAPVEWWTLVAMVLLVLLAALTVGFFRDPERLPGEGLLAPVHGRVLGVEEEGDRVRVSTFMSPLDVHVVRAPLDGTVVSLERSGSGFHRAFRPEADHNVQLEVVFEGDPPFTVVMISGWLARRIVPYLSPGDRVRRGSRIGLIRFGSRVDVLVPEAAFHVSVGPGNRVTGGSSSLGVIASADS